jgi:hypothetical protein
MDAIMPFLVPAFVIFAVASFGLSLSGVLKSSEKLVDLGGVFLGLFTATMGLYWLSSNVNFTYLSGFLIFVGGSNFGMCIYKLGRDARERSGSARSPEMTG